MAQNISYGQKTAASEIQIFRTIDISAADFDGTDTASMTTELNAEGYNRWAFGFYVCPETAGDLVALSYDDYIKSGKVINDALAQTIPSLAAGIFHPIRVVKVYSTSFTDTIAIGQ